MFSPEDEEFSHISRMGHEGGGKYALVVVFDGGLFEDA